MQWTKEHWYLLVILVLIIMIFFGGYYLGTQMKENRGYKESLKQANKEYKDLLGQNKVSIGNAKEIIDSAGIYAIYAQKQGVKASEHIVKVKKIKKTTNEKISAIDSLSYNANIRYFSELTDRLSKN